MLVEVHDAAELQRALAVRPRLVGVNNRDLNTFKVDLGTTERLAQQLTASTAAPPVPLLVAESGIHTQTDVQRLAQCGAAAILVGESHHAPRRSHSKNQRTSGEKLKTIISRISSFLISAFCP